MHYTNRYPGPLWITVKKYTKKRMTERMKNFNKIENLTF